MEYVQCFAQYISMNFFLSTVLTIFLYFLKFYFQMSAKCWWRRQAPKGGSRNSHPGLPKAPIGPKSGRYRPTVENLIPYDPDDPDEDDDTDTDSNSSSSCSSDEEYEEDGEWEEEEGGDCGRRRMEGGGQR